MKTEILTKDGLEIYHEEIKNYIDDKCVELTQAEYDALPDTKLTDGVNYLITDGENGGGGGINASNILDTKAEIEANTEENKIAGALAVKEVIEEVNNNFKDFIKIAGSSKTVSFTANARVNVIFTPPTLEGYKVVTLLEAFNTVSNSFTTHFIDGLSYTAQCSNGASGELNVVGRFLMIRDL